MPDERPTAQDIHALLAHLLAGAAGGTEEEWASRIDDVEVLPIAFHPRCNWRISARGTAQQKEAIDAAVALVAEAHPYAR